MPTDRVRASRWWLAPVLGVVVLFTAAAGLTARTVYQRSASNSAPVVLPSGTSSVPAADRPGSPVVKFTADAATYPLHGDIQQLLQSYFDAINNKNYNQWRTVVTAARSQEEPLHTWESDYQSTRDGNIDVYRVDVAPQNGLRVLLSFTSMQDLAHAPPDFQYQCIQWQAVWPLTIERDAWKLDIGAAGKTPQRAKC